MCGKSHLNVCGVVTRRREDRGERCHVRRKGLVISSGQEKCRRDIAGAGEGNGGERKVKQAESSSW